MRLREYIEKKAKRSVSAALLRAFGLDPNYEGSEKQIKEQIQKAISQYPSLIPDFIKEVLAEKGDSEEKSKKEETQKGSGKKKKGGDE